MLKNQGSTNAVLRLAKKWSEIAIRLPHLELLLEAKQIEAEIADDPTRLITNEELERQITEKIASN